MRALVCRGLHLSAGRRRSKLLTQSHQERHHADSPPEQHSDPPPPSRHSGCIDSPHALYHKNSSIANLLLIFLRLAEPPFPLADTRRFERPLTMVEPQCQCAPSSRPQNSVIVHGVPEFLCDSYPSSI